EQSSGSGLRRRTTRNAEAPEGEGVGRGRDEVAEGYQDRDDVDATYLGSVEGPGSPYGRAPDSYSGIDRSQFRHDPKKDLSLPGPVSMVMRGTKCPTPDEATQGCPFSEVEEQLPDNFPGGLWPEGGVANMPVRTMPSSTSGARESW
ncbi:unnamed protein product, partial [Amoebophrya sp. A25]